ncbi:hypothetical protein ACFV4P_09460 [Kitasatospora sp. NPDC059795]|uniref:WXG100-like domain-containing protein n=1 Tax=Kitasatospora sp. NPDC059795 TaxID=3346949 RepID=UPI00364EEAB5
MIQLPADLAEVLKTVQKNENGKDIAFPDANEELLAELAAAWDKWNQVADTHVRAITEAAQRAMASMSGPAADSFQQYLQKFAGGADSHVATTLQSGAAIATSLHGASGAVIDTKNEMVRELQYAKTYMEQNPAGKHDDIANSEGIKQAAAVYHQYVGQVVGDVDGKLRKSAGHIADMTGIAKTCALNGSGGAGGSGGVGGSGGAGGGAGGGGAFDMTARDPSLMTAGLRGPGGAGDIPGGPLGGASGASPFSLPDAPGAGGGLPGGSGGGGAGSHGGVPGVGGMPGVGGVGSGSGGGGSAAGAGGSGGGPALAPFKLPTPNSPNFGGGDSGSGGGGPMFNPVGSTGAGPLNIAGLGDLGTPPAAGSTSHYSPLGGSPGPGLSGGSPGGSPFGTIGTIGGYPGSSGGTPRSVGPTPFRSGGGSNPFGSSGGSSARGGSGGSSARGGTGGAGSATRGGTGSAGGSGIGGGARVPRSGSGVGLGAAGGASARGMSGASGASGVSGAAGRAGSGLGAGGAAGAAGRGTATGGGAMGGHGPGMGGAGRGGGKGEQKGANRFLSPTRFGMDGEEDEELLHDRGILGQAGEVDRDRKSQRAHRRWLDDARSDGTFATPEHAPAPPVPASPASEQEAMSRLAGILLGTGGAADAGAAGDGAETPAPAADLTARREAGGGATPETASNGADDTYLERARSAASRRGHGEASETAASAPAATPAAAASGTAAAGSAGAAGAGDKPQRAPLREEGGFQVPSPFLRAALSRLATAPGAATAPAAD